MDTDAVVLDCRDHAESDVIITLYGRSTGRLSAIAKGAKKSKKRFVNKLELFTFLNIQFTQKANRSLAFLSEAELHTSFINIRSNPEIYRTASVIREILLVGVRDAEPDENLFRLCLWALHNLNQKEPPQTVLILFLIRFFDLVGYRPDLQACLKCKIPVNQPHNYRFIVSGGGLFCSLCIPQHQEQGVALSHGTIKILQSAQDQPLEKLHRLKFTAQLRQQALNLLHGYARHILQRDIISWRSLTRSNRQ